MPNWERINDSQVYRAGRGEWYNQPHLKRWDMGEDAQDLPTPPWQRELKLGCETTVEESPKFVADLSGMTWLVSHDWGFLLGLSEELATRKAGFVVVVQPSVLEAAKMLAITGKVSVVDQIERAL